MICVPAEFQVDDASIIAQMQRVTEAMGKLDNEMWKLRTMINTTKVKEKGENGEQNDE